MVSNDTLVKITQAIELTQSLILELDGNHAERAWVAMDNLQSIKLDLTEDPEE